MSESFIKAYNSFLQLSILLFTSALVYFAFVYYPRAISTYKTASLPQKPLVAPVAAESNKFPIETDQYRIVFEAGSETYYVFINGNGLEEFVLNKNGADLAIKNALSETSLCGLTIIYSSTARLQIPAKYLAQTGC